MPFLMIPVILFIVGLVIMVVLMIGFALVHILFWPVLIGLLIWWLIRRSARGPQTTHHTHTDWQQYVKPERKMAQHVHEEAKSKPAHHDDDWSDF
ncbi:hypothetical protein [Lacticaseibacillus daqingensis]|uniref:hypothetical protein n=1 Tax=Lacticaseibacillus daqingensis TaxID=2486014 RepID=UPI000F779F3D|nr:hypothetical protein [Lacticaseibacillus daqingensis]